MYLQNLPRVILTLALLLISAGVAAQLQTDNSSIVAGIVTDAEGRPLEGATIQLKPSNYRSSSNREGEFSIPLSDAPSHTLVIKYPGLETIHREFTTSSTAGPMNFRMESRWIEEVVVTATRLRNSQAEALARQQSADRRVDIIAADNIGQFPDKNAAEALTRLPGVSADLAAGGRPRTVQIRGMPDRWTTVAYDGLNIIGSRGRVVRFDEIPAAIINSVELSKTTTPDMAAESVSGAVNIVTASPFDFEGFFANVATSGGTAGYDEDPQKEFSIQMGSQNDDGRFGWMVVGAMLEREFKEERFQSENLVGENTGIVYPSQLDLTNSRYQQSTPGGALRLEWRPDDLSRIFLTTVYTRTEDDIDE